MADGVSRTVEEAAMNEHFNRLQLHGGKDLLRHKLIMLGILAVMCALGWGTHLLADALAQVF